MVWDKKKKKLNRIESIKLDNNKGFINIHFLQKMDCQKTEWHQARFNARSLSSNSPISTSVRLWSQTQWEQSAKTLPNLWQTKAIFDIKLKIIP